MTIVADVKELSLSQYLAVTASDTVDLAWTPRAILITKTTDTMADVAVIDLTGVTTTLTLACGLWHPCRCTRVMATNTTATKILIGR